MYKWLTLQLLVVPLILIFLTKIVKADSLTINIACNSFEGTINENNWGIASPDKYLWWPGNKNLMQQISDAQIKLIRVGPVQLGLYTGHDIYPSPENWRWDYIDEILNTIWESGAQPLFLVCGYPQGVTPKDWNAYARFMEIIVHRYNVAKTLGENKTIKYWEMWNEPTIEGDGLLDKDEFRDFVEIVGAKMKSIDPTIKLVGPADAWANLGKEGYVAFTAENLAKYIDVLSWHDYGPMPDKNDSDRMSWTEQHYHTNALQGKLFGDFGVAITEYNISHADGGDEYNKKYHNEFAAVYMASAIINAIKAKMELFTAYNLAETGKNLLGVLSNDDYLPFKPYYSFYLFGNYTGDQIVKSEETIKNLEVLVSKDTDNKRFFITVVNKSMNSSRNDVSFCLNNLNSHSGNVIVRKLDAENNPSKMAGTFSYTNSKFNYSIPPMSIISFEVHPLYLTDVHSLNDESKRIIIYPSPVRGNTLNINASGIKQSQLTLYDYTGNLIFQKQLSELEEGVPNFPIDISMLKKGVYFMKITNASETISKQFLRE